MPTPLEKIKTGIENKDWYTVSDGYFDLTGTKILVDDQNSVPLKKKRGRKPKAPQILDAPVVKAVVRTPRVPALPAGVTNNEAQRETQQMTKEARPESVITHRVPVFIEA